MSTDADGRYEIRDLPSGRYTLTVTRNGYLTLRYGQRRPLEQGKPLEVAQGQLIDNVDFVLPRMSVIRGRVTDELGEPIEGANVFAMQLAYWNGRRRVNPASQARSDDAGEYRLTGLMPGSYWVMANLRETWTTTENGKPVQFGYTPTYLPGVANVADAQRVVVGLGEQVSAQDVSLLPGRTAKVSGTAIDSRGRPLAGGSVGLTQETVGRVGGMFQSAGGATVGADGTFVISNVAPGEYKIRAHLPANREPGSPPEIVTQVLTVDGQDVEGVHLVTTGGFSISGRVRAETGEVPAVPRNRLAITADLVSPDLEPRTIGVNLNSQIRDDLTFEVTGIFGPSRLRVTVPDGWATKEVLYGDRDVTDEPLDMKSGEILSGVEVVLTNRITRISAQLTDEKGAPVKDGTLVVFSSRSDKWFERSRWVRAVRPNQQGMFEVTGLPPGEYLAAGLDYVQEGIWNDPEYVASLVQYGQKVTLRDAESTSVILEVVKGSQ